MTSKLDEFKVAIEEMQMTVDEMRDFNNFFVGAAAEMMSDKTFLAAVAGAKSCLTRQRERQDKIKSTVIWEGIEQLLIAFKLTHNSKATRTIMNHSVSLSPDGVFEVAGTTFETSFPFKLESWLKEHGRTA